MRGTRGDVPRGEGVVRSASPRAVARILNASLNKCTDLPASIWVIVLGLRIIVIWCFSTLNVFVRRHEIREVFGSPQYYLTQ